MDLNEGLYDEIITSELDGDLEELNSRTLRARSIDLSKDSIATRVSERYERSTNPRDGGCPSVVGITSKSIRY